MWLQRLTNYLLAHRLQALLLTFLFTFIPIIGILGILFAGLVTLQRGSVEGFLYTCAATLPYVISFYLSGSYDHAIPIVVWAAVGVAVLSNVLTWVFAVMLRQQADWSSVIQVAALFGILIVSVIHLAYPQVTDWWGTQLQAYYNQAATVMKNTTSTAKELQIETINITKQYATGLITAAILFNAIMQLVVSRWWQATIFNPGQLRRELHNIRLSQLAGMLFVLSLVFSYLGNKVVLDIMPILYLLFGAAGLSLIHYLFGLKASPTTWLWLAILYITLIISLPTSIILIAILALIDVWMNLRKRFKKNLI